MSKYRITMMDQIYYEIIVEADTEDEAIEIAQESVDEAEVVSDSYVEVIETEEIK